MRLDICYRMTFGYDSPVWESQNEIRVRPRSDDSQQVIARRLVTAPTSRVLSFVDYWGTTVDHVGVREPHLAFEIVAEAAVDTSTPPPVTVNPDATELWVPEFALGHAEFLAPSSHTGWTENLATQAQQATACITTVRGQIDAIIDLTRSLISYESGSTSIGVSLEELAAGGLGVCQDFAHLSIGLLRSIGIPARYVSGYLFAADETMLHPTAEDIVRVQTHAWIEAAIPGHGWHPFDPTNATDVEDRHAVIGHGRDYDDVAPVRGVFVGDAVPKLESEVVIERMAPASRSVITDGPRRLNDAQFDSQRRHRQAQQQ